MRSVVDLPAPLEPNSPVMLPLAAVKLTSETAINLRDSPRLRLPLLGKDLDMDSTVITDVVHWHRQRMVLPVVAQDNRNPRPRLAHAE